LTVGTQMHQTLASLESACADLKSFALETEDKTAKKCLPNTRSSLNLFVKA